MSPPNIYVTAWWPRGSSMLLGHIAHPLNPDDVSILSLETELPATMKMRVQGAQTEVLLCQPQNCY